jgi:tRNA pseudouridine55 synthase
VNTSNSRSPKMVQCAPDGVIVVNKPAGWTSHDVVARMRGIAGTKRVGHLGTLDPIATGVLPLMIGQATRLARFLENSTKTYEAVVRFGFATSTYDKAGEPGPESEVSLTPELLEQHLAPMRGEIDQVPPPVSAKKIGGVPAYKLVRANVPVDLAPVRITIEELELKGFDVDRAKINVRCTTGTYIRSIAHEWGKALGCGAHIEELSRTSSGAFTLEQAWTLEALQALKDEGRLAEAVLPLATLPPTLPSVTVDEATARQIRQGRDFHVSPFRQSPGSEFIRALSPDGELVAIGEAILPHMYHPTVVMATE